MLKPLKFMAELAFRYWKKDASLGPWMQTEIQRLGPVYVKIAQILGTRNDIPSEITSALENLQDKAEGIPFRDLVGVQLPRNVVAVTDEPIAAASLGIVYHGKWREKNGVVKDVAIKVMRPNVKTELSIGLWGFPRFLRYFSNYSEEISHVLDVCRQYRRSIYAELNYLAEAANFDRLARSLAPLSEWNRVPEIYAASQTYIIMEFLPGAKINDTDYIRQKGLNPEFVANNLLEAFLHQCLVSDMFHSDCHAGNISIGMTMQNEPYLIWYDCGSVIICEPEWQNNLVRLALAFLKSDIAAIISALSEMGIIQNNRKSTRAVGRFLRMLLSFDNMTDSNAVMTTMMKAFTADLVWREDLRKAFVSNSNYVILGKSIIVITQICTTLDPTFNFVQRSINIVRKFWNTNAMENVDFISELTTVAKNISTMPSKVSMLEEQIAELHEDMAERYNSNLNTLNQRVLMIQLLFLMAMLMVQ